MRSITGFLTKRQIEILRLRGMGHTQEEIAKKLRTTRENVTITEKRARENIKRARATLEAFELLEPVRIKISAGSDLFQLPRAIFREADRHSIHVLHNTTSLIGMLRRRAGDRISGNRVAREFRVLLLRSGRVRVK